MKYLKLVIFLAIFWIPTDADAAIFYADLSGACGGDGTATTTPFCSLDEFADVARSAGDILHVRRGTATTTGITDLTFTSDGTLNNPIVMTADYDNLWGDFSTSSVTVTVTQGSTTMPTSASTTDITVGDWIYIEGDCQERSGGAGGVRDRVNPCEYAYEVATATPTYLEFYFPYKGFNNGSGKAIRRMPPNPIWNTTTGDFQWLQASDDYWILKGFHIRGTDSAANLALGSNPDGVMVVDMILEGDGVTVTGATGIGEGGRLYKFRTLNHTSTVINVQPGARMYAGYINCGLGAGAAVLGTVSDSMLVDVYIHPSCSDSLLFNAQGEQRTVFRNVTFPNGHSGLANSSYNRTLYSEDNFSTPGNNIFISGITGVIVATTTLSTTTNLRSSGGIKNLYISNLSGTDNVGVSALNFPFSFIKLFEYPIYSDGTSKTYTMYFKSASTSAFTVSPFTSTQSGSSTPELFIECEYYADPVDADRVTKRSNTANDVDFTSADWQDISVTCDPSQAGILYLRGYYGKPKEGVTNQFYMDTTPVTS